MRRDCSEMQNVVIVGIVSKGAEWQCDKCPYVVQRELYRLYYRASPFLVANSSVSCKISRVRPASWSGLYRGIAIDRSLPLVQHTFWYSLLFPGYAVYPVCCAPKDHGYRLADMERKGSQQHAAIPSPPSTSPFVSAFSNETCHTFLIDTGGTIVDMRKRL